MRGGAGQQIGQPVSQLRRRIEFEPLYEGVVFVDNKRENRFEYLASNAAIPGCVSDCIEGGLLMSSCELGEHVVRSAKSVPEHEQVRPSFLASHVKVGAAEFAALPPCVVIEVPIARLVL